MIPTTGFNRLKECWHGLMLYNVHDLFVGRSLELYGEYSEMEIEAFQQIVRPGDIVLEVGANLGAHTLWFARAVGPRGSVMAFEPQRILFQTLCANMALNSITNAHCWQVAVGAEEGYLHVPLLDHNQDNNFGAL